MTRLMTSASARVPLELARMFWCLLSRNAWQRLRTKLHWKMDLEMELDRQRLTRLSGPDPKLLQLRRGRLSQEQSKEQMRVRTKPKPARQSILLSRQQPEPMRQSNRLQPAGLKTN